MLLLLGLALVVQDAERPADRPGESLPIQLEIRIFDGLREVADETRILVYPSGSREAPIAEALRSGRLRAAVTPGLYDVAVVRQQNDRVLGLRWAERLVVMEYPDEAGEHLQVINLQSGYGALQIRRHPADASREPWSAAAFPAGDRTGPAAMPVEGNGYILFVLPAGRYDIALEAGTGTTWLTDLEVPRDRTRLAIAPPS